MKILKGIKKMVAGAVLYAAMAAGCAFAPKAGFNQAQAGFTPEQSRIERILLNDDIVVNDKFEVGYHGLNEVVNEDKDTYFGDHKITVGLKDVGTKALIQMATNSEGVIDKKIGIRNYDLCKLMKGYGNVDLLFGEDGAINLAVFYGKPFGKGKGKGSVELFHSMDIPKEGDISHFTELQLNKALGKGFSAFLRGQYIGFELDGALYLIGVGKEF